jgi:cytoskeleton protein RodZ
MSIGEVLKSARTQKQLTIGEVSTAIRVNKKYIQAMEDGNFLILPSLVYAKGFVKAYAEFLELDSRPLIDELLEFYRLKEEPKKNAVLRPREQKKFEMPNVGMPKFEMPKFNLPKFEFPKFKMPRIKTPKVEIPKFTSPKFNAPKVNFPRISMPKIDIDLDVNPRYVIFGLLVIFIAFFAAYEYGHTKAHPRAVRAVASIEAQAVEKPQVKQVKPVEKKIVAGPTQAEKHVGVKVIAVKRSWVTITSDGVAAYNGIIDEGRWINFRGREVKVNTGNAEGVRVVVNGVDQGLMGVGEQVSEKTFYPYK